MKTLQALRFRLHDASVVSGQPDDGRQCNQLWREEDPRHLLCMASKRQWGQARWRIGVCACCMLGRCEVVQCLGR